MNAMLEEVKPETVDMLIAQAKARGLSVDDYLRRLLGLVGGEHGLPEPTLDEFEADMNALAEGTEHLPPELITYSRADIYFDHD